ncbi:MAG: cyclodeaminase/cyclohydrolase family protein [Candidatus Omnitrophica bacterium]|nr:cyclodeaminase/cyclohydrolase family protein [Candidatus Omnitrophota bacterium]
MRSYKNDLKKYIHDLSVSSAHPAGGSCAALSGCLGISLIQMALRYSGAGGDGYLVRLEKIKKDIIGLIDRDGELFERLLRETVAVKKKKLLHTIQEEIMRLANGCGKVAGYARAIEPSIKKTIISDFYAGLKLCEVSLYICVKNLQANQRMFKIDNARKIQRTKKSMEVFKRWG